MSTLVIEHLKASELPQQWVQRLKTNPEQRVTVRIETESAQSNPAPTETFATDDPAFGIWRDRSDVADVTEYINQLRAPRYNPSGSRNDR
jgi:hypothetical protein